MAADEGLVVGSSLPIWRTREPLEDGPEVIMGEKALASALHASVEAVAHKLHRNVDPIPARHVPGGLIVFRSRLRLWLQRYPHNDRPRPHPDIPHLLTLRDIGDHLHLGKVSIWRYRTKHYLPVYGTEREVWAYVEALNDWLDMMSVSLKVRRELIAARRVAADPES